MGRILGKSSFSFSFVNQAEHSDERLLFRVKLQNINGDFSKPGFSVHCVLKAVSTMRLMVDLRHREFLPVLLCKVSQTQDSWIVNEQNRNIFVEMSLDL